MPVLMPISAVLAVAGVAAGTLLRDKPREQFFEIGIYPMTRIYFMNKFMDILAFHSTKLKLSTKIRVLCITVVPTIVFKR